MLARVNHLSVRLRVVLVFCVVMLLVLAATGLFVYYRLATEIDATIEKGLRSRAADVTALIEQADSGLARSGRSPLTERGENLAQILDASGAVVDSTPTVRGRPLLDARRLRAAMHGTIHVDLGRLRGEPDGARLLATPVTAQDRRLVVVVGAPLEDRKGALRNLAGLLLIGGLAALLLASAAGYGAIAAALRPVERMRRRAADIHHAGPRERLPVPATDDELSRLGRTLNEMLDRLETAFERERTFVSDASHELRTPLAILKTELELALRDGQTVEELQDALRSAGEEADRLIQLAEDLLVIARSEQGKLPIRREEVRVAELLEAVARRFSQRAEAAQQRVETVPVEDDLTITADFLRLEQALGNLVDNALRHGDRAVVLSARRSTGAVQIHVTDNGPGFPQDFAHRAFERFSRADIARGRGGSGLGLAIVAAIVRAHGGEVGIAPVTAGGADVWMSIPLASQPAADPAAPDLPRAG